MAYCDHRPHYDSAFLAALFLLMETYRVYSGSVGVVNKALAVSGFRARAQPVSITRLITVPWEHNEMAGRKTEDRKREKSNVAQQCSGHLFRSCLLAVSVLRDLLQLKLVCCTV